MAERMKNQEMEFRLPPTWCSSICRNSMNEICVEHCAIKRDCSAFEEKPNLRLEDMPRFPMNESARMTKEERFTSVTIYLSKVVDHLQGTDLVSQQLVASRSTGTVRIDKAVIELGSSLKDLQDTKENE